MVIADVEDAQRRTEEFLTGQMMQALHTVDYALPSFHETPQASTLAELARARVELRHARGASDAMYLIAAFDDELMMQLQLNVWRLVVVYRVPANHTLDAAALAARLERWRIGAEHAGWIIGWREASSTDDASHRFVETYCYATTGLDFLDNPLQQLYWRTDIVQMTRSFMLEARRAGLTLSPARAGYRI